MPVQPCRLSFGPRVSSNVTWILHARSEGAPVPLDGAVDLAISGEFDNAAVVIEGSFDNSHYEPLAAPIRSAGRHRLDTSVKHLRPVARGGNSGTTIIVSLVASKA